MTIDLFAASFVCRDADLATVLSVRGLSLVGLLSGVAMLRRRLGALALVRVRRRSR